MRKTCLCLSTLLCLFISNAAIATPTVFELYRDITPGAIQARPSNYAIFNGELFFEAANAADNDEPFRFDGTNLVQITNANPLVGDDSNLTSQFVFNGNLYAVMESNVGRELFQYNTGNGQYEIHTNLNGANDGYPRPMTDVNGDMIIHNGHLLMEGDPDDSGDLFYYLRSDNNQLQLVPGSTKRDPSNVAIFQGDIYFEADDGAGNDEPFRLTNAGVETQIVNASPLVGDDSNLTNQFVFNGNLYAVMESNVGRELYQYNTGNGQYEIHTNLNGAADGYPRPMSSIDGDVIIINGHLLMEGDPDGSGDLFYLLRSDNNQLQLMPGSTKRDPSNTALFQGDLYFEADDGAGNDEPFVIASGVETQITNANAPAADDSNLTSQFVYLNDLYAVMESDTGRELYKYNTGNGNYERMLDLNGAAGDGFPIAASDANGSPVIYENAMLFSASDTNVVRELFRLRGLVVPPEISIGDASITEGNAGTSQLAFTVTRSNNSGAANVNFNTANGTATAGSDYVSNSGTVQFTAGGSLTQNINITINGDTTVELNETFVVNLSNPTNGATLTDSQGQGTINNNDSATISINDVSVNEGNSGTTAMTFTATLSNNVDTALSVSANSADNTATTADSDYAATNTTLNFAGNAGETQTVTVNINGDAKVELNESLFMNLSNIQASGRSVTFADSQGQGTITNDDNASLSVNDVMVNEGNAGTTALTFTATLNNAVDTGFSVDANSADGTATVADNDYAAFNGTLNFTGNAGETQTATVNINGDAVGEPDETLFLNLSNIQASGRDVTFSDNQGLGTIANDDTASITINDITDNENAGTFDFTVTLNGGSSGAVAVDFTTNNGTATNTNDFTATSGTLNFTGSGGETQTISVTITDDNVVELDQFFTVDLSNVQGNNVVISDSQGQGNIINDDNATLVINDLSATEGNSGSQDMVFSVLLDNPVDVSFTVNYGTTDGTATFADSDYDSRLGTLNFSGNGGETQSVTVPVNGDGVVELDEMFTVLLSNLNTGGRNVTLADDQGTGTINNDDAATLTIDDVTMAEGQAGPTPLTFTVTLDSAVDTALSIDANTADNSATTADNDYTAVTGSTLNFSGNAGETQTVTVNATGDLVTELDESFFVNLSALLAGGRDVTIADGQGLGTLTNDDSASLSIADVTQVEGNAGTTTFSFDVTLDQAVDTGLTIDAQTADGSATTADNDYQAASNTLNFVGLAGEVQTLDVLVNGDMTSESTENFTVNLLNLVNNGRQVTVADTVANGTITNDDAANITIDDVSMAEGNAGNSQMVFTVTLNGSSSGPVTVDYASANGTADTNDYVPASGTLNFTGSAGETQQVVIDVVGDLVVELDETFDINLTNPTGLNVTIDDPLGVGTLSNDDNGSITINDVSLNEGNTGITQFNFTVVSDSAVDMPFTLDITTTDGTATVAASDYFSNSDTLSFTGSSNESLMFSVDVNGDTLTEVDETFQAVLSNLQAGGRNLTISDDTGLATILNDDSASLSIDDVSINEGDAGTSLLSFTVSLAGSVKNGVSVDYQTNDGSALAGSDYTAINGTLNFAGVPGESQTIDVSINGDAVVELDETLTIQLSNLSNAGVTLSDASGLGTLTNDDSAQITLNNSSLNEGNSGTTQATITATLDLAVDVPFSIDVTTQDGSATAGDNDYIPVSTTLQFTGLAGESQSVDVDVVGDLQAEADETFSVTASNVQSQNRDVSFLNNTGDVTILGDDPNITALKEAAFVSPLGQGDTITYTVSIQNTGFDALLTVFDDTPDANTQIIPGSVTTTMGTVTSGNTAGDTQITVDIGTLTSQTSLTIQYEVQVNMGVNFGVQITNQGMVSGNNFSDVLTDDPNVPGSVDPTVAGVGQLIMVPALSDLMLVILAVMVLAIAAVHRRRRVW